MKSPKDRRLSPELPETLVQGEGATHARALTKAVTWRMIGTLDTFLWSLLVTHHPWNAGKIASIETFTKIFLFYVHERVWRFVPWDPHARLRSLAKAVSWRLVGSLDTYIISLLITGNARYALEIASFEAMSKIVLYYLHERVWRRVKWGRLETPSVSANSAGADGPSISR